MHVTCNIKPNSITNGFYEFFEAGLSRNKKTCVDGLRSKVERINLQAEKFMKFLNKKNNRGHQNDKKENVSENDLIMMAKSEMAKERLK